MDLLNHWKLDELRIAIIRDLADFIPENYYELLPNNDLMQRGGMDWELYKLIKDGQERTPKKFSARQVAACDVFKWIAIYVFTNAGLHKISKLPSKDAWFPERQAEYEVIKSNLNKVYELICSSSDSLFKDLNNWLLYLPANEAKPFHRDSFEWTEEETRKQISKFVEKFGFLPEYIRETSLDIENTPQIQKSKQLESVSAANHSIDSQTEKQDLLIAEQNKRDDQDVKERHELGRYTLDEAADFIGNNAKINKNAYLEDLKESAGTGELKVYRPHGLQRYKPKPIEGAVYIPGLSNPIKNFVPAGYVEAFWDDLNNWLEKKEPRVGSIFPNPNLQTNTDTPGHGYPQNEIDSDKTLVAGCLEKTESTKHKRINQTRAFLQDCFSTGIEKNIESVWLHIRRNTGKDGFLFVTASKETATTIDGKCIRKKNMGRCLNQLIKEK